MAAFTKQKQKTMVHEIYKKIVYYFIWSSDHFPKAQFLFYLKNQNQNQIKTLV